MINVRDQFALFYYIQDRADKMTEQYRKKKGEGEPSFEEYTREVTEMGKAYALIELARDIISANFPNQLAAIDESRRLDRDLKKAREEVEKQ